MTRKSVILPAALFAAAGIGVWVVAQDPARTTAAPQAVDLAGGERLYGEYCASCHGANLEGQPDWRSPGPDGVLPAPPHDETGHTWHHPDGTLFDYTKLGGEAALTQLGVEFQSGMPGFGDQLTDAQIWDILAYIKSTWPDRQREGQAARSDAARQHQGN
ncbi:cytochrome c [Pikeienuella sp. HZG-20]|uniref:c-type cytochrome n=1 Tax=Paludibacillus litoralis TaxID=3133267 RepID=UPI0030EC722A